MIIQSLITAGQYSYLMLINKLRLKEKWHHCHCKLKGALSQDFCRFQLHSLLKSLPGTSTRSENAQMD